MQLVSLMYDQANPDEYLDQRYIINSTQHSKTFASFTLARKDNERIADVIKEKGYSAKQYRIARDRFAYFLVNY